MIQAVSQNSQLLSKAHWLVEDDDQTVVKRIFQHQQLLMRNYEVYALYVTLKCRVYEVCNTTQQLIQYVFHLYKI